MRLALGTANFATQYGIANTTHPTPAEVQRILRTAWDSGIRLIDTAQAYGVDMGLFDGFDVINKIGSSNTTIPPSYGLLAHNPNVDMMSLIMAKYRGIVQKIGAAVYSPDELPALLVYPIDIIQLPLSVFDLRFYDWIRVIKANGVQVHIRSVFLQGLLLMHNPPFATAQVRRFQRTAKAYGYTPAQYALGRALACGGDVAVVGVNSAEQLAECAEVKPIIYDSNHFGINDEDIINPTKWRIV
jgi:aryl-alcohol dehydrogenase-like predicted oxidoreductase